MVPTILRIGHLLQGSPTREQSCHGEVTLRVGDQPFTSCTLRVTLAGRLPCTCLRSAWCSPAHDLHDCQTWLMESDVTGVADALERIRSLDVDHVLPGHGR